MGTSGLPVLIEMFSLNSRLLSDDIRRLLRPSAWKSLASIGDSTLRAHEMAQFWSSFINVMPAEVKNLFQFEV